MSLSTTSAHLRNTPRGEDSPGQFASQKSYCVSFRVYFLFISSESDLIFFLVRDLLQKHRNVGMRDVRTALVQHPTRSTDKLSLREPRKLPGSEIPQPAKTPAAGCTTPAGRMAASPSLRPRAARPSPGGGGESCRHGGMPLGGAPVEALQPAYGRLLRAGGRRAGEGSGRDAVPGRGGARAHGGTAASRSPGPPHAAPLRVPPAEPGPARAEAARAQSALPRCR